MPAIHGFGCGGASTNSKSSGTLTFIVRFSEAFALSVPPRVRTTVSLTGSGLNGV